MLENPSPKNGMARGVKRAFGAIAAAAVAVMGVTVVGSQTPSMQDVDYRTVAEVNSFNPFDVNNGFTIVTKGDATLGNNELEGSIAAFGSVGSSKQNYPLVHKVAGEGNFTVPLIDGDPVRLLADKFVDGGGSLNHQCRSKWSS